MRELQGRPWKRNALAARVVRSITFEIRDLRAVKGNLRVYGILHIKRKPLNIAWNQALSFLPIVGTKVNGDTIGFSRDRDGYPFGLGNN